MTIYELLDEFAGYVARNSRDFDKYSMYPRRGRVLSVWEIEICNRFKELENERNSTSAVRE